MQSRPWLRRWAPTILGAAAIWALSTEIFSDVNTGRVIYPVLSWLFPHISTRTMIFCHKIIRKLAHVTVYFFFSMLALHSIRGEKKGWRWQWALMAVAIAAVYAVVDEIHQTFVPMRHGAVRDVLLDICGATAAQAVLWWHHRDREQA